jgi:hypothetical protein
MRLVIIAAISAACAALSVWLSKRKVRRVVDPRNDPGVVGDASTLARWPVQGGYSAPPGGSRPAMPKTGSGVRRSGS